MRTVVYLQRKAHKAGAQTCLARLVQNPFLNRFNPTVICSEYGWLTTELERTGVRFIVEPFPSSRSIVARLISNALFVNRVAKRLGSPGSHFLVHGNDHQEGILTVSLARALRAFSAITLRSSSMNKLDYTKYHCSDVNVALTVSQELMGRLNLWDPQKVFSIVSDGVYPEELTYVSREAASAPRRFVVLGSHLLWKGWRDVVDALCILRLKGVELKDFSFDFTGIQPGLENNLDLSRLTGVQIRFLGHRDDFPSLLSRYDFAIHPSRHETFGMAAVETIACGLPLISSRTGVLADLIDPALLYTPGDVNELSDKLNLVINALPPSPEILKALQKKLLSKYNINDSAKTLARIYDEQFE